MSRIILTCALVALVAYALFKPRDFGSALGQIASSLSSAQEGNSK